MSKMMTIGVEAKLDEKYRIEVKVANHVMIMDQTKAGGGMDAGPSPPEYLFASLAGCIGTVARIVATQKRIPLRGMDMIVEGALDLETLLGKGKENRAGFTGIKVKLHIDADLSRKGKEDFLKEVKSRSPLSDNITNPTPVVIEIA